MTPNRKITIDFEVMRNGAEWYMVATRRAIPSGDVSVTWVPISPIRDAVPGGIVDAQDMFDRGTVAALEKIIAESRERIDERHAWHIRRNKDFL